MALLRGRKGCLERHGGTVEKFIGDAVMAVFGAPVAHEDDPERAVRAAIAIRDVLSEEAQREVRISITTGEALVTLGTRPEACEAIASETSSTQQLVCRRAHPPTESSSTMTIPESLAHPHPIAGNTSS